MNDDETKPSTALAPMPRIPDKDPPEGLAGLAREYPGLLIGGGLALGLLAGALVYKRAGGKITQRVAGLATAVGEIGLALSRHVRDGQEPLDRDPTAGQQRASNLAGAARGAGLRLVEEAIALATRRKP